jgi:carbamoyl-phosphate synthase small subunit
MRGKLILADGSEFEGTSFGYEESSSGEVVFNTGMVGYPESLTDPSYFGQIMVLTYPLIGNYGAPDKIWWESKKIWVKGLIVQNYIDTPSHFEHSKTLGIWLKEEKIPALFGIDTRMLTRKLREHGVMLGEIQLSVFGSRLSDKSLQVNQLTGEPKTGKPNSENRKLIIDNRKFYDPNLENVLPFVSVGKPETFGEGKKHIVLIDCGAKGNIMRSFLKRKVRVTVVPWDFDPLKLESSFDGVMISNGPGDPKMAKQTISNLKKLLKENIPTFGICLGSQLLALAAGGDTYKLKFGHRGHNQPVMDVVSKRAYVTSQNHGFAVNVKTLPDEWMEWFVNLNDGSNEGIRHKSKPFFSVQFHPEASPGPVEAGYLFDEFLGYL